MIVLLKFIGCSVVLLFLFQLFLAKEKTFSLNRWVLVLLVPTAMVVPFVSIPLWLPQETVVNLSYPQFVQSTTNHLIKSAPTAETISIEFWVWTAYLAITLLLFAKKLSALIKLVRWTKVASVESLKTAKLILSKKVSTPFSFGNCIFMHPSTYLEGTDKTEMIIKHELIHITQKHHIDLAIIEFLTVICWFNPVVILVKKAMVLNHEYLADQGVKETVHPIAYKKLLLNLTRRNATLLWTSAISSSTLKHRLIMLNQPQNKRAMRLRIVNFSLSALLILAGFSLEIDARPYEQLQPYYQLKRQADQNNDLDKLPTFKGGMAAFSNFVKKEAKYPLHARKSGKEGQVLVQFVVEKDGSLSNVSATRGSNDGFQFLAERIIRNAPAFHPGFQNGRPVRVQLTIPLIFTLSKELSPTDKLPMGEVNLGEMTPNKEGLKVDANHSNGYWKGTVRDHEGNLLPGALIKVEGTNIGTVTNTEGQFYLKSESSSTLIVSFTGYKNIQVTQN